MEWTGVLGGDERRIRRIMERGEQCLGQIAQSILPLLPAGRHRGEDALDVAAARTGLRAEGAVALADAPSLRAFGTVIRRLDSLNTAGRSRAQGRA